MTVLTASRAWWEDRPTLRRVVSDLLAGELALMRPARARRAPPWPSGLDLAADLGADSLELLGMATAMEEVLAIGCIGEERVLANPRLDAWVDAVASSLAESGNSGGRMVFRTSGSSGAPKSCPQALAELEREAQALAQLFAGTRRIIGLVASHHIYGFLFTVLLPRALGLAPPEVHDLRGASPGAVARRLQPGDLVVGFPDFWRTFAPVASGLPPGVAGVSSTAPCPDEVAHAVRASGIERLVQVYGSSETAGVGWREGPDEDYRLFPWWQRGEPDAGGAQTFLRQAVNGNAERVPLQDRLEWQDATRFRPAGRVDQAVQVGGVNVFPGYVADVLRMHPQVADASVRLMRPDEGRRLKAFVVPRADALFDADTLRAELTAWMAERLTAPERPSAYSFGAALPRQASGKPTDWIIDAWP